MGLVLALPALAFASQNTNGDDGGSMAITSVSNFYPGGTAAINFTAIDANLKSDGSNSQSDLEGGVTVQVDITGPGGYDSGTIPITLNNDQGEGGNYSYSGTFAVPSNITANAGYTVTLTAGDNDDNGKDVVSTPITAGSIPGPNSLPEVPYAVLLPIALLALIPVARRVYGKAAVGRNA